MSTILCYGDSLTWGFEPITQERQNYRWTRQLAKSLSPTFEIIEEGLCGRTVADGLSTFTPIVKSHLPFEILVLFIGTNSTKNIFKQTSQTICTDIRKYFSQLKADCLEYDYPVPKVILISPPDINLKSVDPTWGFDQSSADLLKQIDAGYQDLASEFSAHFLSGYQILGQGSGDGVHLSLTQNQLLSQELFKLISSP